MAKKLFPQGVRIPEDWKLEPSGRVKRTLTYDPYGYRLFENRCNELGLNFGEGMDEAIASWLGVERKPAEVPAHLARLFDVIAGQIKTPAQAEALTGLLKNIVKICEHSTPL